LAGGGGGLRRRPPTGQGAASWAAHTPPPLPPPPLRSESAKTWIAPRLLSVSENGRRRGGDDAGAPAPEPEAAQLQAAAAELCLAAKPGSVYTVAYETTSSDGEEKIDHSPPHAGTAPAAAALRAARRHTASAPAHLTVPELPNAPSLMF